MTEDERKELLRNWAMMESKSAKNNDTSDNDPLGKLERLSWIFVCSAILIFTTALLPALLAAMHESILLLHGSEDEYYKGVVNIGAFVMFSPVYIIAFPAALVGLFWLLFEPIIELPDERSFEKYRKITSKLRLPFI